MPLALWGGSECTINRVGDRYLNQAERNGHHGRPGDIDRIASLGISALRYPLLWESFAACSDVGRLWAWHEKRLNRLHSLGVRPILGLIHHGAGPATTSLVEEDFAEGLAAHAGEAAARFPWIEDWTPVNEPLTTARFSALYGHWFPHLRDERSFWLALINQIDAIRASMREIRAIIPGARLIQTEDLGHTAATAERSGQASFDNQRRWASWDMLVGRFADGHDLWDHLAQLGFTDRLTAIAAAPCPPDLLGLNHYLTSDRFLDHRIDQYPASALGSCAEGPVADVEAVRAVGSAPGLEGAIRQCWARYAIPIAITEVHNGCTREEQMRWLNDAWTTAHDLRGEGIAIEAVTVWSLFGAFDWGSLLTVNAGDYESGVFDIRGERIRETALAPMIRKMAAGEKPHHPVLSGLGWWKHDDRLPGEARRAGSCSDAREQSPLLILGSTGTLGQAFAGACRLRDIDHCLTGRDIIDICDAPTIGQALDRLRPWAVINCAGWVAVDAAESRETDCLAANFRGSVDMASACAERGIHYTCFSSDLVFDGLGASAYVESDVPNPLNIYGESKALADAGILAADGNALIVRTASFFSPYDNHNFAMHLVSSLRSGQSFRAVGDCVTSPTYVPDLVRATLDLVIDGESGLWHLSNGTAFSWAQFAHAVGDAMDLRTDLIDTVRVDDMGWAARRPRFAPLRSERGILLPTLDSAIERFVAVLS